jgi:lipoyl(octanoyl) transferase
MLQIKHLSLTPYAPALEAMKAFTASRSKNTPDEIWLLEHPPIFTLGQAGKPEHLLQNPDNIPVIRINRGGQITYHGPGQLVAYLLIDLARRQLKVRDFVNLIEEAVIRLLAEYGLQGGRKPGAPGVYINGAKICALGLRVTKGCSYHGLALNVSTGLTPFTWINPCGYKGLKTTRLADFGITDDINAVGRRLVAHLQSLLPPTLSP